MLALFDVAQNQRPLLNLRVARFEKWSISTRLTLAGRQQISWHCNVVPGVIMAIPKHDKHKDYVRYAEHCLKRVPVTPDQEYRVVQREMAAEWLKLADAVLHPLKRIT